MISLKLSHRNLLLAATALLTLTAGDVFAAGSAPANLTVSAVVVNNCTITTGTLVFGNYDPANINAPAGADLTGSGTFSVTCTKNALTTIALSQGATAAGGSTDPVPLRQMNDGGSNNLAYFLYQDAGLGTVWGNDVATSLSHTGTGTADTITVYGAVTKGQNIPAGNYTDTVVATINF